MRLDYLPNLLTSSSEQYSGLIIDNSFLIEDDGGKSADLGPNCPENLSHSPAVRTLKPSPELVSNLYYSRVVLQCQTTSLSGQVCDCWICEFCGPECFCSGLSD